MLARRNAYGLLSEDIEPDTGELWGNLPQTYSMAGIINTATLLVVELGGSMGSRLIIVSNRVPVPERQWPAAGGRFGGGGTGRAEKSQRTLVRLERQDL